MAVKTFTTGEVLTAADTNTYLNNGGLVYITEVTATSSATVTITNCFSATYDAYRVVVTDWSSPAASAAVLKIGAAATAYYGAYFTITNAGAVASGTQSNTANWTLNAVCNTTGGSGMAFDLQNPYLAKNTIVQSLGSDNRTNGEFIRMFCGYLNNTTSYSDLTFSSSNANTAAKIAVYGYRKA